MEVNLQGIDSLTVINAYAPTSSAEYEKVEQFYNDIERAMADSDSDIERAMADSDSKCKIITGDFNAEIRTETKEADFKNMETFGIGERNERGDCLIELAEEYKLIIANTLFQEPKNKILDLGVTQWGNKKPNRFYIE